MRQNPRDGQSKYFSSRARGRAFRQQAMVTVTLDMATLAARFPAERLAEALSALTGLRQIMDAMRDPVA